MLLALHKEYGVRQIASTHSLQRPETSVENLPITQQNLEKIEKRPLESDLLRQFTCSISWLGAVGMQGFRYDPGLRLLPERVLPAAPRPVALLVVAAALWPLGPLAALSYG